jgi:hypothetical protein
VRRLPEEGEAEVDNKGGVRGEGTASQLLAMVWETGGGPVRRGGARRMTTLSRLDRGREVRVGPARQRGRRGEGRVGRLAGGPALGRGEVGYDWVKTRDGQRSKRNSFRTSINFFRIRQNFGKLYMEI